MKFHFKIHKTALNIAEEKGDSEIINLLLSCDKIEEGSSDKIHKHFQISFCF